MLRHVESTEATVWVETDAPCEVRVLDRAARTFCVAGHHYALIELADLEPGITLPYTVTLDDAHAWPPVGDSFPPPVIRTIRADSRARVVFGSCRTSRPHAPPWTLDPSDDEQGQGIDALRTLALGLARGGPEDLPECLLMLGDQVYADDLSPAMLELTGSRRDAIGVPDDELGDFEEFAAAYQEAWSEPGIRWLLSTVPTAMIFDDHEIHAQWKISKPWMDKLWAHDWFEGHIADGLMAYWVYQHLGNLSHQELRASELYDHARTHDDAEAFLREDMREAHRQPGHSRWSFSRDLGTARLVVIDSRAGRVLDEGNRQMIDDGEWDWVIERCSGDHEHLLLASSVPFFLTPGLHHLEAWDEAVADGNAWGRRAGRVAEKLRQTGVMDHWASFNRSFERLTVLLRELATGVHGDPPALIVMLSGDVHHCYLAQVDLPSEAGARTPVWQAVCSAYRKSLLPRERLVMRFANSRVAGALARGLARSAGREAPDVGWRLVEDPCYGNQVGTLVLGPGRAQVRVQTTEGSDWREPRLRTVFERELACAGEPDEGSPSDVVG